MAKLLVMDTPAAVASLSWHAWAECMWIELRPQQWLKNLLVLAPLLFSKNLFNIAAVVNAFGACFCFCLISSSVYLLNDIRDYEQDRLHPEKSRRPLAAGHLANRTVLLWMVTLLFAALAGALWLSRTLVFILISYWIINLLYSLVLKQLVILDVFAIASGFVMRVLAGEVVVDIRLEDTTPWLLLCTTLLALFLGFSKRRHELVLLGEAASQHRSVLNEYGIQFLDTMIGIVTASTVMSYALYTVSDETVNRFQTHGLIMTVPFVLYGIFRYLYLIYHKNQGGNPTRDLLTDQAIVINLFLWAAVTGTIIYLR
jgi:4-hydroxybenzoate polyprenyltransferase